MNKPEWRIQEALEIAERGQFSGEEHHTVWVLDQIVRALTGDDYEEWVRLFTQGSDGEANCYIWDEGIAP